MGERKVRIDLVGIHANLEVLEFAGCSKWGDARWKCRCLLCNRIKVIGGADIRSGKSTSCGDPSHWSGKNSATYTHGQAGYGRRTPEYRAWINMENRCYNTEGQDYENYGGRGIKVCDRWRGDGGFVNFLADVGPKPKPIRKYSLDRIDNNGNYEPFNCRWATTQQQARNRRRRRCPHCGHTLYNDRYGKD